MNFTTKPSLVSSSIDSVYNGTCSWLGLFKCVQKSPSVFGTFSPYSFGVFVSRPSVENRLSCSFFAVILLVRWLHFTAEESKFSFNSFSWNKALLARIRLERDCVFTPRRTRSEPGRRWWLDSFDHLFNGKDLPHSFSANRWLVGQQNRQNPHTREKILQDEENNRQQSLPKTTIEYIQ